MNRASVPLIVAVTTGCRPSIVTGSSTSLPRTHLLAACAEAQQAPATTETNIHFQARIHLEYTRVQGRAIVGVALPHAPQAALAPIEAERQRLPGLLLRSRLCCRQRALN